MEWQWEGLNVSELICIVADAQLELYSYLYAGICNCGVLLHYVDDAQVRNASVDGPACTFRIRERVALITCTAP